MAASVARAAGSGVPVPASVWATPRCVLSVTAGSRPWAEAGGLSRGLCVQPSASATPTRSQRPGLEVSSPRHAHFPAALGLFLVWPGHGLWGLGTAQRGPGGPERWPGRRAPSGPHPRPSWGAVLPGLRPPGLRSRQACARCLCLGCPEPGSWTWRVAASRQPPCERGDCGSVTALCRVLLPSRCEPFCVPSARCAAWHSRDA